MPSPPLPDRPALKRHLLAKVVESTDVFLLSEDKTWLWKSRALGEIVRRLDGLHSLSDIFNELAGTASPPEIMYLLNRLNVSELLYDGAIESRCQAVDLAMWHALGVQDNAALERMLDGKVRLWAIDDCADATTLALALTRMGVANADAPETAIDVLVTDHYHRPELGQRNATNLASGKPWMLCKLVGSSAWIGPIFRPGQTGCFACLQDRLRLNRQAETYFVRTRDDVRVYETSLAALPSAVSLVAALAAQEIALWLAGRSERLEGRLLSVSWTNQGPELATHQLVRRPQCPVCGDPGAGRSTNPIVLESRQTVLDSDAGTRVQSAEATLQRLAHHISPITGVVTWLVDIAKDPEGLVHSYAAGHNFAMGTDSLYWLQQSLRSRTGGKGASSTQAQVSAMGEAIERYSGVFRGDEPRVRASYRSLGGQAIHPHECLNFSDGQYDRRDVLNAANREGFIQLIPRRFPEDLEIDWVPLWSLIHEEIRYLPAAFCYYGHPDVERHFYCAGDSNGCAAGNVLEEAVLQAFLELVERDSTAIWWYNRVPRPLVDLESFDSSYLTRLPEHYRKGGREFWVVDLTTDTGIPVFAAISRRLQGPTEDLLVGLGAHLDPSIAVVRAATEMNQFLPAVSKVDAAGNTVYSWPDDAAVRFWKEETLATQPHLRPASGYASRTRSDYPNLARADLYENIQICVDTARRAHLDFLVLDQSRPDIALHVARVVVPGFRHFWRRLGPGRLYDVPVDLGWQSAPTREDDLNSASVFF